MITVSKIIILSHSSLFNHSITALIKHITTIRSVSSCTPQKAISNIRILQPSTIIIDISFNDFSVLNLLHKITKQYPHLKIVVITDNLAPAFLAQLFMMKISACLSKNCKAIDLIRALNHRQEKKMFYDKQIEGLITAIDDKKLAKIKLLSRQEFQIMTMLAHGMKSEEIAKKLHLSTKTVSSYHTQILAKLQLQHNLDILPFIHKHQLLFLPMKFINFLS